MNAALAAVFHGVPGELSLQHFSLPAPLEAELLVRVLGCTLCGSDIHTYEGHRKVATPTILGHEIVGEISAFGTHAPRQYMDGKPLSVGDRVVWAIVASCNACQPCLGGLPQKCVRGVKYGHEPVRPGSELLGGLAEYVHLVPGTAIFKVPDELPLETACPASCATATVAAALEAAGDLREQTVLVLGAGMLGLTACAMARHFHAREIICVDVDPVRYKRSMDFGATQSTRPESLAKTVAQVAPDTGVNVILEFSGASAALQTAWPLAAVGGRIVLVGSVFESAPIPVQLEDIVRRCLSIRGIHNYEPRHLRMALEFLSISHKKFPFAELVEDWYSLQDSVQAFKAACHRARPIRIGIRP